MVYSKDIGSMFYSIQLLGDPNLRIVESANTPVLKETPFPIRISDPGTIFMEDVDFNVFRFKMGDRYVCRHSDRNNYTINLCDSASDPFTEWSMVRLDDYYQIRTKHRGLCMKKSSPVGTRDLKEFTVVTAICQTTDQFKFTLNEIIGLNKVEEIPPPPPILPREAALSERIAKRLGDMVDNKEPSIYDPVTRSDVAKKILNSRMSYSTRSYRSFMN